MKIFKAFCLLIVSFGCHASIVFPEAYEVLKVNGKTYENSFFSSASEIKVNAEKQVILYRYNELFEDVDNDDHTKIKSAPFVLIIDGTSEQITIKSPELNDIKQAREYALNPTLVIVDTKEQLVSHTISSLAEFEQTQYDKALHAHRLHNTNNNLPEKSTRINVTSKVEEPQSRALSMLNYWWQQASEQEKRIFIKQQQLQQ